MLAPRPRVGAEPASPDAPFSTARAGSDRNTHRETEVGLGGPSPEGAAWLKPSEGNGVKKGLGRPFPAQ